MKDILKMQNIYMYAYVYIYAYRSVCVCACVYTYIYVYIYIYTCVCVCVYRVNPLFASHTSCDDSLMFARIPAEHLKL